MEEQWDVILYKTPTGDAPVRELIFSLEVKAQFQPIIYQKQ